MWKNEEEARKCIKELVVEYYHQFKEKKESFKEGDRISYASRVFDEKEMCALTDATLDFWLTTGRFADQFEREFARWIGVRHDAVTHSVVPYPSLMTTFAPCSVRNASIFFLSSIERESPPLNTPLRQLRSAPSITS